MHNLYDYLRCTKPRIYTQLNLSLYNERNSLVVFKVFLQAELTATPV